LVPHLYVAGVLLGLEVVPGRVLGVADRLRRVVEHAAVAVVLGLIVGVSRRVLRLRLAKLRSRLTNLVTSTGLCH